MVPLDAVRKTATKKMGFKSWETKGRSNQTVNSTSSIYYVFPYSLHLDNMERVCNILLLQKHPCLIDICLRPYSLTEQDESKLEERINLCEKYSQLALNTAEDIEILKPFLKIQASTLYENCSKELNQLQDAAYLLKVQITSSKSIEPGLATTIGASITEHTGHPNLVFTDTKKGAFTGGYDWYRPEQKAQFSSALANLKNMQFKPWIPSMAESALRHWRYVFDVSQAIAAFRLPMPIDAEFPGIDTAQYHPKAAPSDLPTDGLVIGEHFHLNQRRKVFISKWDRLKHTYVVGQTGTGKSTLFLNMILQDIRAGHGIGVIDPHGELIEELLPCIPPKRKKDIIYMNPLDYGYPVGINLLEYRTPFEKDFCVNYLIEVFDVLYNLRETGGPIFEMYMRNALQLLLDQSDNYLPTVLDVPRVFQQRSFRKQLLDRCTNIYVRNFWIEEAEKAGGDANLANVAPYITSKLSRFIYNDTIRCILGQRQSTIDFRWVIDSGKILLVDLRKGLLGETNSHFLGMILVGKLLTATLSRTDVKDKSTLRDFYLYVDEFQNLATPTFVSILSEARKYKLSLTITNQYIEQLKDYIIYGILGNVGTLISFRVGSNDAAILSNEFGEIVSKNDLMGLPNWHAYMRLLIDGNVSAPFNIRTILPEQTPNPKVAEQVLRMSRKHYGCPRKKVEAEIQETWLKKDEDDDVK